MPSSPPWTRAREPASAGTARKIASSETSGRNALRGPDFFWSDFYLTKWFTLSERVKLRLEGQFFNVFNHPNFGLPSIVFAGIPGKPSTQTGFGALTYTTSPPTGLLGVGLGGDSSPRMIALQARLEFQSLAAPYYCRVLARPACSQGLAHRETLVPLQIGPGGNNRRIDKSQSGIICR